MDYSKLSNEDLLALKNGDYSSVSNEGLLALKDQNTQPQPEAQMDVMGAVKGAAQAALPAPMKLAGNVANANPAVQQAIGSTIGGEVGLVAGGIPGAMAGSVIGGGVTELAQNPTARNVMQQGAMETAKGNLANAGVRAIDAIQDNPEAVKEFGKRRAVEAAGAMVGGAITKAGRAVKASGPFTAGVETPSLASEKVREKIMQELGKAKTAAKVGQDAAEASRLRRMLAIGQAGKVKLAEEAIDAVSTGKKMSNAQLLAYEEALGKVQSKGGSFADDYEKARTAVRKLLKEQAPTLDKYKALARKVFLSEGEDQAVSLVEAIRNPISSASRFPGAMRTAGAATRGVTESGLPLSQAVSAGMNGAPKFDVGSEMDKAFKKRKKRG